MQKTRQGFEPGFPEFLVKCSTKWAIGTGDQSVWPTYIFLCPFGKKKRGNGIIPVGRPRIVRPVTRKVSPTELMTPSDFKSTRLKVMRIYSTQEDIVRSVFWEPFVWQKKSNSVRWFYLMSRWLLVILRSQSGRSEVHVKLLWKYRYIVCSISWEHFVWPTSRPRLNYSGHRSCSLIDIFRFLSVTSKDIKLNTL